MTRDDFGDLEFVVTREMIVDQLKRLVCDPDDPECPWAGPDYWDDHGHTSCLFIGHAIKELST